MKRILILISFTILAVWQLHAQSIILTSDEQLEALTDPEQKLDLSLGYNKYVRSLREICEEGQRRGSKEINLAFDEFFRQYRNDTGAERKLTPDMDAYVDKIKIVSDFAKKYDLGLCLSLLSPLELGQAYKKQTGNSGRWLAYKVGFRDPKTGKFDISIWQQLYWTNNKGKSPMVLKGVKAYAFKESGGDIPFRVVEPENIVPLTDVQYEATDTMNYAARGIGQSIDMRHLQVFGEKAEYPGYDRVLVMLEYETQEMDYFNADAPVFLKSLMDKYHEKGVNLTALYSDEMHIQQDWSYFSHHENGQFAERYLSQSFSDTYSKKFGQPFDDKYLLYFVFGAPNYEPFAQSVINVQYVMGPNPEDIHRTFLLRDRYYKLLNNGVVDLFKDAKTYAESLFKRELRTSAHASWAESPTIDLWNTEKQPGFANQYEYTSNFIWSNTVHQASAACYDYFKWGEYLEPTGNDFAECGWSDRNYYGAAMATSIGVINKYPNAYAAAWGFPKEALERRMAINHAFGAQPPRDIEMMTGGVHRDVEVLAIYPMSLVAVEERFGSWMTQYGYANYLSAAKLLQMGKLQDDGKLAVKDKSYGTVVVLFEPLPEKGLLDLLAQFVEKGGKVLWYGTPPMLDSEGKDCTAQWQKLAGATYHFDNYMGEIAAGKEVAFSGSFSQVPTQTILTDFLVDRIYPVDPEAGEVVARCDGKVVGVKNKLGEGDFYYLGFRPRDDQSKSLGYETRTLFENLNAAGAYPPSGAISGINDNPSVVSRTSEYFVTTFPNTTTMVVRHYRTHRENWEGGFSRNAEHDAQALAVNPLPTDKIELDDAAINGHRITYNGRLWMAFRTNENRLSAFIGNNCNEITIDGKLYHFTDQPLAKLVFIPESKEKNTLYHVQVSGLGKVKLPIAPGKKSVKVKVGKQSVPFKATNDEIELEIGESLSGKWITVVL
ncbi:hypothetical protein [Maribellus sp. YY47]|uniref:hypothetical protein n=1 Tax=Maribellus sp. YY47 TaxID=2929486 RepID=UPI0020018498|nr:hypothetical protein [Maribellus sp. YY47]MCK3683476.1 hypothetical protein [Maribellus sp. YY47]